MSVVQEIKVIVSKGTFVIEIEKNQDYKFSVSPIDYPNNWILENNKSFNTAEDCFEDVILGIQEYCKNNTIDIYDIDNPCNCELISADKEKEITKKLKLSVPVKINGNLR